MNLSQLLDLVNESDYQTLPNKSCRVPTGESILGSNAFKRLDFKKNRMIIVERVDQEFFRDCKVRLSKFSFSRVAYDKIRACRTNRIIIIDSTDNINSFLALFAQDQNFYKILSQISSQEIDYKEPDYYRLAMGFDVFDYQEIQEEDPNLTIEEIYEIYYLDDWSDEYQPWFNPNSPFDEEDYQEIDEWVELIKDGRRIENSQLISKKMKGYFITSKMEFFEDDLERYDEEGEPYIREILIGNKLLSSKQFTNLTVREPF